MVSKQPAASRTGQVRPTGKAPPRASRRPPRGEMRPPAVATAGPVRGAQLVSTAAQLMRALAGAPPEGWRLVDLVERTALQRSAVGRIVNALCVEGLAAKGGARYALGPLAFELGLAASQRSPLPALADAAMRRLAERTGDTCFLMVRSGDDAVCLDRREGAYPIKSLTISVGDRRPLGCAAGSLALLMHLGPADAEHYIARHAERIGQHGHLNADVVRRMLTRARRLGYALNHDDIVPHVSAVGIAIPSRLGQPYAALSVSTLTSRMMASGRREQVLAWLEPLAREIAARL